jgi:predicted RNase H-like HicB family nuclease
MARSKKLHVLQYELPVQVRKDPSGGFVAISPAWSDCYAQGDSIDEVTNEIASVASSLIELYREEGLNIPLKKKRTLSTILKIPVFSTS